MAFQPLPKGLFYFLLLFTPLILNLVFLFAGTSGVSGDGALLYSHLIWIGPSQTPQGISFKRSVGREFQKSTGIHNMHRREISSLFTPGGVNVGQLEASHSSGLSRDTFLQVYFWNVCQGKLVLEDNPAAPTNSDDLTGSAKVNTKIEHCSTPQLGSMPNIGQSISDQMPELTSQVEDIETDPFVQFIYVTSIIAVCVHALNVLLIFYAWWKEDIEGMRPFISHLALFAGFAYIFPSAGLTYIANKMIQAINAGETDVEARLGSLAMIFAWIPIGIDIIIGLFCRWRSRVAGSEDAPAEEPGDEEEKA